MPCTGCGACSAACRVGAIGMIESDGFVVPHIEDDRCVDCGACTRVCYKYLDTALLPQVADAACYATYSRDKHSHATTTSGGFGYELARWGLERGYKVVGTAYDYASHRARAIVVDSIEELESLKGSKYLQSLTEDALREFVDRATKSTDERFICFGTPCQIFGLRKLAEHRHLNNEIIYVDLFCHGVPSYLVWDPYIASKRSKLGDIGEVNFRYKGNGWHHYSIRIAGERGTYSNYAYNDTFYRYFFDNVVLNRSCYTCTLRKGHSAADIRIGDFLGSAYEHREDGITAAVGITARGVAMVEELEASNHIYIVDKHPVGECLKSQSTHDYDHIELRNEVIRRLHRGDDIATTQRWYTSTFPTKRRIYLGLKSIASLLPNRVIAVLRRRVRSLR